MFKLKWLFVLVLFLFAVQPNFADDRAKILGIWKMLSQEVEDPSTGNRTPVTGKNPMGYLIFTPEGRMMVIVTGEGRKTPKTDQDRANLLDSMSAYTGMYRLEGDKYIVKVDVAWDSAKIGTEQVRFFRFDSDRLYLITRWIPLPTNY